MNSGNIYLTKEGYKKLIEELEFLKKVKRRELSKAVGEAVAHGDITENAEYDAAKEAQALNEKRIAELEEKLARVHILDDENLPKGKVCIGTKVKLKDLDTEEELEYTFMSELEANYSQGKVSITSPIGQGLVSHKENETVEIKTPGGILKYKILKITR